MAAPARVAASSAAIASGTVARVASDTSAMAGSGVRLAEALR